MIPQETSSTGRSSRGGEAASLSFIKVRRAGRAADAITKTTDLTRRLQRPPMSAVQTVVTRVSLSSDTPLPTLVPASSPSTLATPSHFSGSAAAEPVLESPIPANLAPAIDVAPPPATPRENAPSADTAHITPLPDDHAQSGEALLRYWNELRGNRDVPLFASLDRTRVAMSWLNSLMVSQCGDSAMPQITQFSRLTGEVEYTSMVTEWILSCSRQVARTGEPLEREQDFPVEHRSKIYRMLLLPFSSAGGKSDRVLCHLSCVE